jgi:hypothetical protein
MVERRLRRLGYTGESVEPSIELVDWVIEWCHVTPVPPATFEQIIWNHSHRNNSWFPGDTYAKAGATKQAVAQAEMPKGKYSSL